MNCELNETGLLLPREMLAECQLADISLNAHLCSSALVLLPERMSTRELVCAWESLRKVANTLFDALLTSCEADCEECRYTNDGRTMSDEAFERKANAAAHIDELVEVSTRGGETVLDADKRHGNMAKNGWNYRTAYFMDFDGSYYKTKISVALGNDGNIAYNIGQMQKRNAPQINGSSGNTGAQWGNASKTNIRNSNENVNRKISKQERACPTVKSSPRRWTARRRTHGSARCWRSTRTR